jgi:hypothetical protein
MKNLEVLDLDKTVAVRRKRDRESGEDLVAIFEE